MSNEALLGAGFSVMVALQSWTLLSIVAMRERVTKVETQLELLPKPVCERCQ